MRTISQWDALVCINNQISYPLFNTTHTQTHTHTYICSIKSPSFNNSILFRGIWSVLPAVTSEIITTALLDKNIAEVWSQPRDRGTIYNSCIIDYSLLRALRTFISSHIETLANWLTNIDAFNDICFGFGQILITIHIQDRKRSILVSVMTWSIEDPNNCLNTYWPKQCCHNNFATAHHAQ